MPCFILTKHSSPKTKEQSIFNWDLYISIYCCVIYRAGASKLSVSMCGKHAGWFSVRWMWCYRSTKGLCCPIQQGIQTRISSQWMGLWLPLFCRQERLELSSTLCWLLHCVGPVCRASHCAFHFGIYRPTLHAYLSINPNGIWCKAAFPLQLTSHALQLRRYVFSAIFITLDYLYRLTVSVRVS